MSENLLFENEFLKFSFPEYPDIKVLEKNGFEGLYCYVNNITILQPEFEYCRFDQLDNRIHLKKNDIQYCLNFYLKETKKGYIFYLSHFNLKFSEKQTWIRFSDDEWETKYGLYLNVEESLIFPVNFKNILISKLNSEGLFYVYLLSDNTLEIYKNANKKIASLELTLNQMEFLGIDDWELTIFDQDYSTDFIITEDEFYRKGLVSLTGEILIQNLYQEIVKLNEAIFLKKGNNIYLFNSKIGSLEELNNIENIYRFSLRGLIFFSFQDKVGAFNYDGKIIIKPQFDKINYINYIGIKQGNRKFNKQFQNKFLRVIHNKKVGFINNDGEIVIKPKYDYNKEYSTLINLSIFYNIDNPTETVEKYWIQVSNNGKLIFLDAENNLAEIKNFKPRTILPNDILEYGNVAKTKIL